ncbi:MAG: PfkB family carbohydrate kinase [Maricaulaceae bacterium]|jgi:pyridoxine kinase
MTPPVLIISSHVAASAVGARATAAGVERAGAAAWPVPTTVLGRHPGWGAPGGRALPADHLKDVLEGVLAHPDATRIAWAVTGYFAHPDQPAVAAEAIRRLKAGPSPPRICVDPIMGDADVGLYAAEGVAEAIADELIPLADMIAPNAWEAERLAGVPAGDPEGARAAAAVFDMPALISSVRAESRIGAVYADAERALFAHAPERAQVPKGTGDLLTGAFVGAIACGAAPAEALLDAVRCVEGALTAAEADGGAELPLHLICKETAGPAKIEAIDR